MCLLNTLKNEARKSMLAFSPTIRVLLPRVKSSFRPPKVLALARDLGSLPKVKGAATVKALGFQKGVVEGFKLDLLDRKSTRLNSSHGYISYAVFCLKKKQAATTRRRSSLRQTL